MTDETRICKTCGEEKLLECFARTGVNYRRRECQTCQAVRARQYNADHPERVRATKRKYRAANPDKIKASLRQNYLKNLERRRATRRKRKYGILAADFKAFDCSQGGLCAICGGPPVGNPVLSVDHCHKTDRVRGLLCHLCNVGLGCFKDSPERLQKALVYLQKFSS